MKDIKKIYIVGIEGAGTSALAQYYVSQGMKVSGSDEGDHFYADVLQEKGVEVFDEFTAENISEDVDLVVHSTVHGRENVELEEAEKRDLPILSYPEAVGEITKSKKTVAVCGTHGKSTTSAMAAQVFQDADENPSAIIGSKVKKWNSNFLAGDGDYFVLEADEYQNKLQHYSPWAVILTNLDYDHPDFFPDFETYKKAFRDFVSKIPKDGILVFCADDEDVVEVAETANCRKISYGFSQESDVRIKSQKNENGYQYFEIENMGDFKIKLPGKHNALNATSVIALANELNLGSYAQSLKNFEGISRRFEYVGEKNGAILFDDYAHHPQEVKAVLKSTKEIYPDKEIIALFHPHSFTRTEALLEDFAKSFDDADKVYVLEIYGSAREKEGAVSSKDLVNEINKHSENKAEYTQTIPEAIEYFQENLTENKILISIGAGDVWRVTHTLAGKMPAR